MTDQPNGRRFPGFPALPQAPVFAQPNKTLPSLVAPNWPGGGFDPRGYQPGYDPNNAPDNSNKGNPFGGFCFLSAGSKQQGEFSFGSDLFTLLQKPGEKIRPQPWVLTICPSAEDIQALHVVAGGGDTLHLYYRIEYKQDAQFPNYIDGSFLRSGTVQGFSPLSLRGMRVPVAGWAFTVTIAVVGTGSLANWQALGAGSTPLTVRVDGSIAPSTGVAPAGNPLPRNLVDPSEYLPEFSYALIAPQTSAGAGSFSFKNISETVILTYPMGPGIVPIPPDAIIIAAPFADSTGLFYLF